MKKKNEDFQIKRLEKQDVYLFENTIQLFQQVFEMKKCKNVPKKYLQNLLQKSVFIVYAIIYKTEIVGGLTAYELPMYYSESSEIFIYDIAIKQEFQRKGLGQKLILFLKKYCKENGIREFFVAANKEDKYALDFYNKTGGKPEKVVHFNYFVIPK